MLSRVPRGLALLLLALLSGCSGAVLHPSGDVAWQQRNLVIASTVLMLLIIIPVMALTAWFGWKYRASNKDAKYDPDFHHSTQLELVIWSAPLLIIIALGAMTWISTHTLDPYRQVSRLDAQRPLPKDVKPLKVQAVAMDWKWLFIYPDLGIATVNEMAAPVDVPLDIQITATSVMNAFYVPALAGMIYAMPAMETQLHAVINQPGDYAGFSANYSGAGFSDMKFRFLGKSNADFAQWVEQVKAGGGKLERADYLVLAKPSEREPVRRYAAVAPNLYDAILNLCVEPGKMCLHEMMKIDAEGGAHITEGMAAVAHLAYDQPREGESPDFLLALCATPGTTLAAPAASPAPLRTAAR